MGIFPQRRTRPSAAHSNYFGFDGQDIGTGFTRSRAKNFNRPCARNSVASCNRCLISCLWRWLLRPSPWDALRRHPVFCEDFLRLADFLLDLPRYLSHPCLCPAVCLTSRFSPGTLSNYLIVSAWPHLFASLDKVEIPRRG